jgi:hypothetical protein
MVKTAAEHGQFDAVKVCVQTIGDVGQDRRNAELLAESDVYKELSQVLW